MNAVKKFNGLNGTVATRQELEQLIKLAKNQEQTEIVERLEPVLSKFDHEKFLIDLQCQAVECIPASILPFIDEAPELPEEEHGLGKAVSPDDIYQYITDLMLNTIKVANKLPWQTMWEESSLGNGKQATNYESKKAYRGINFFLLNFELKFDKEKGFYMDWKNWENPYFLTFNQVEKYGGKVKEGTKAYRVVYFTRLYKFEAELEGGKKIEFGTYDQKKWVAWLKENKSVVEKITGVPIEVVAKDYIPILKYYNVFNGGDVEGIDFKEPPVNPNASKSENEKIEVAEAIVKSYPKPPDVKMVGNQPAYYPKSDRILMTPIEQFKNPQFFYSVFFHELTHSTGHSKRLDRGNDTRKRDGSKADKKAYDFEELVAEMGAVFLCAESGILFQTRDQSAVYLRHYLQKLTDRMEEDNRFFFRAASASQAAADHILNRDKEGNPAYLKTLMVDTSKPKVDTSKKPTKPKKIGYMLVDNITGETVATKKTLLELNRSFQNLKKQKDFQDMEPLVYEIVKKGNKNVPGEKIKVDWLKPIKKTKSELEKANPKGFAKKPKSVAVATAIKDVLSLPKYKGKINERQAAILYKHFKDSAFGSEIFSDVTSDYERGILNKENEMFDFSISNDQLEITEFGMEFVQAINGRRESLHNQKHSLALFEGLKGYSPKNPTIKDAIQYAEKYLIGKSIYHRDIDKKILFTSAGIKKAIQGKTKPTRTRIQLVFLAKDLVKKARLFKTEKDKKGRNNIVAYHTLRTTTTLDGKRFEVIIKIQEKKNGSLYYDHTGVELKKQINVPGDKSEPLGRVNLPLSPKEKNKDTKKIKSTKKGLKSPAPVAATEPQPEPQNEPTITLQPEPTQPAQQTDRGGQVVPAAPVSKKLNLMEMEFDSLQMDEGWENFMQHPAANMKIAIYGKPKNGKTSGALKLANYLTKHGRVLYNFADQGFNKSTKDLWITSGLANKQNAEPSDIDTLDTLEAEIKNGNYKFVFIDMINDYINREGIKPQEFKDRFIKQYPNTSFILVFEVTKDGNFKGDQGWTHIVDAIVTVENFLMENRGRYGIGHFLVWEEGLKKFDPKRYEEIMEETQHESTTPQPIEVEEIPGFSITEV